MVVLIHHCCLVSPALVSAVESRGQGPMASWLWWMTYTPVHLIWAGKEAVYVFFILSGFVLALPVVNNSGPKWPAYFSKRLVRIYLPVWASLVFALALADAIPREASSGLSPWLNMHDEATRWFSDALLLSGPGSLNSPLWSLQWEMIFSLLLPLYIFVAIRINRAWLAGVFSLLVLIALASERLPAFAVYLPMFGIGVMLAARVQLLRVTGRRVGSWGWAGITAASLVLLCAQWLFPQLPGFIALSAAGGALLIFACIAWRPTEALGKNRILQWLGTRSFSLYLVHEPIVVSIGFASHITNPFLIAALAIPLSLVATEIFYRFIERPSLLLAGRVGRLMGRMGSRKQDLMMAQP